ncbi:hypothetical protein ACTXG6_09680 [Pseudonocardia sp. Cha107L01]|uniref:hypothetical protein n=1 Tax=Pseudonocardia sp. Cha107L01 TaxID=3457576 RepID=UPI00403EAB6A
MKFAVIGGTGLIGSQVVQDLNAAGHEAVPHGLSPGSTFSLVKAWMRRWPARTWSST